LRAEHSTLLDDSARVVRVRQSRGVAIAAARATAL